MPGTRRDRDQDRQRLADDLLGAVAEHALGGEVEQDDFLVRINRDDAIFGDHQDARGA